MKNFNNESKIKQILGQWAKNMKKHSIKSKWNMQVNKYIDK